MFGSKYIKDIFNGIEFSPFYKQTYAVGQFLSLFCMKASLKILQAILEEMEQKRIRYLRLLRASR